VVLAKLLYACAAWWGFTNSAERDRIEAFVRRRVKLCLYQDTDPIASQLVEDLDDKLFRAVLYNTQPFLHHLLPNRTDHSYTLRPRRHDCSLSAKADSRNLLIRQLFKTCINLLAVLFLIRMYTVALCHLCNKDVYDTIWFIRLLSHPARKRIGPVLSHGAVDGRKPVDEVEVPSSVAEKTRVT